MVMKARLFRMLHNPTLFALLIGSLSQAEAFGQSNAFFLATTTTTTHSGQHLYAQQSGHDERPATKQEDDDDDDMEEELSEADARLSDILPPAVSFSRNSILFSEKPVTQRNNEVLTFWRGMKSVLPPVITGAWPWRDPYLADENPLDAFYNIVFVRLPVIIMGLIYAKNLTEGHPLIMDYGDGPFEVSPLIVIGVLALVLA